jgi:threonine aldolase
MDGARIFNAAAALNVPVSEIASKADTVMFCLSKALGSPAGSMLVGPRKLIDKGRLYRKRLGGGMRQAGVLAAAGLIALHEMPACLQVDHANANRLARGLADLPGVSVDPDAVQTNIALFDIAGTGLDGATFSGRLKERGILANAVGPTLIRMVTHHDVTERMCLDAINAVREILPH